MVNRRNFLKGAGVLGASTLTLGAMKGIQIPNGIAYNPGTLSIPRARDLPTPFAQVVPFTIAHLQNEILTDPSSLGFAPEVAKGGTAALAKIINEIRASVQIDRQFLEAHEVFEAIDTLEFGLATDAEKELVFLILGMGRVDAKGVNTRIAFFSCIRSRDTKPSKSFSDLNP